MYESYFGLTERPFSIAPDPDYLYMSSRHKEAMAHLSYGLSQGGCFIVLTGEVGTGKTTLCRNLLSDLPNNVDVALILNANLGSAELLQTVCDELKIVYQESASQKKLLDLINAHLLQTYAQNRHTVLIIDEAQLLKRNVLEQIRLLTNLETTKSKLLQIILIGQPELYDLLSRNDLRQLAQRVTARYHLGALQQEDIEEYVNYRLKVAGCKKALFSRQALNKLHSLTKGIPRKINVLADHALLATYSQGKGLVDSKTVTKAAKEVFIVSKSRDSKKKKKKHKTKKKAVVAFPWHWLALGCFVLGLNMILWWYFTQPSTDAELVNQLEADKQAVVVESSQAIQTLPSELETPTQEQVALQDLPDTGISESASESSRLISDNLAATYYSGSGDDTTLGRKLDVSGDITGRITAQRALASHWGFELPSKIIQPVCQSIQAQRFRCLEIKKWDSLQAFNRPAIMLLNHKEQIHRVLIRSIDGDQANVLIGDSSLQVPLAEIKQRWNGLGLIYWKPLFSGAPFLRKGDQGATIEIVRTELNAALSKAQLPTLQNTSSSYFDEEMSNKVVSLQRAYSLISDGVVGFETYFLFNELNNPQSTPVLQSRALLESRALLDSRALLESGALLQNQTPTVLN